MTHVAEDATPERLGKVTVRAVAARAGVAVSSVSRVLNGHAEVSDELRARVHRAVEELGYQPNLLARSLRSGSTRTIGCIVRDLANPLFADVVKGAESILHSSGYSVLVSNTDGDVARDVEYIDLFLRRRVDGLLVTLQSEENEAVIAALQAAECPVVLLDRDVPALSASAVLCDHRSGMVDAVEHLLALGHRRIGLINAPAIIRPARERQRGCLETLARAGVPVADELVRVAPYSAEFGYTSTIELLDLPDPPTAILSDGIQFTLGSLRALHDRRVRIGEDLSFVSADDIEWLELHDPPISVVHRDHVRIGQLGAELLLHAMDVGGRPRFEPVATTYIHRASVQAAPAR